MHGVAIIRFTPELAQWDPETFVRTVLVEWLHVAEVWVGANFLFGHDRAGNFSVLRSLGARYGFRAEKIDPVRYKDFVVSSTRIRRLVTEGRVDEAGALLGHHYAIEGTGRAGAATGTRTWISDGEPVHRERADPAARRLCDDGRRWTAWRIHRSRTSGRGRRLRSGEETVIETHLLDFDKDLYGAQAAAGVRAAAARRKDASRASMR